MALGNQEIRMARGEVFDYQLGPYTYQDGSPVDLSGAAIKWVITSDPGAGTEHAAREVGSGITIAGDGSTATVRVVAANTSSLVASADPGTRYWHDARAALANGLIVQLVFPHILFLVAAGSE